MERSENVLAMPALKKPTFPKRKPFPVHASKAMRLVYLTDKATGKIHCIDITERAGREMRARMNYCMIAHGKVLKWGFLKTALMKVEQSHV